MAKKKNERRGVAVFLVGPDHTARADFLAAYHRSYPGGLVIDVINRTRPTKADFEAAAKLQTSKEDANRDQLYFSLGNCVDLIVDAMRQNRGNYDLSLAINEIDDTKSLSLLRRVLGCNISNPQVLMRYRCSLSVLVHPNQDTVSGTSTEHLQTYRQVLRFLRVPYIDLREPGIPERVTVLDQAIRDGTYLSPLASLSFYEQRTAKKRKGNAKPISREKGALASHDTARWYDEINLPYFWDQNIKGVVDRRTSKFARRCLVVSETEVKMSLEFPQNGTTNRFVDSRGGSHGLFLVQFERNVISQHVVGLLRQGLRIQGELYSFLGCTSSGLKDRKCYLLKGTAKDAEAERQRYGDFASIKSISKQIARFSLLLSNVVITSVQPVTVKKEADVENKGSCFTDGCGTVSPDLATALYREAKVVQKRGTDVTFDVPSVFQIRHQGNKGVLCQDSSLSEGTIVLRPSMNKFKTVQFPCICVCEYSRPFSFGHLNRQFISLLSGLGVPDQHFLTLQQDHFERIRKMLYDWDAAIMIAEWLNQTKELLDFLGKREPPDNEENSASPPYKHLRPTQKKLIRESTKLKILVPESRTLFGVAEPPRYCNSNKVRLPGVLRPGECLVRLTMQGGKRISLQNQPVFVSKNPCYLLGDGRVLRAVSSLERPKLFEMEKDLVDCIVFPIEGNRPHSEEIAGSDLDGDQYFVCWDARLIPPSTHAPYSYPAFSGKQPKSSSSRTEDLVRYFAGQNTVSNMTGRVDSLFKAWADKKGMTCHECERLGQLFSRVVDSAKSGERIQIDKALIIPREERPVSSADSKYVWQKMEYAAQQFLAEQTRFGNLSLDSDDREELGAPLSRGDHDEVDGEISSGQEDFLHDFVSRNYLAMSEFTKFRLVMTYLKGDVNEFLHSRYASSVNFADFSSVELGFAVTRYGVPLSLLENALRYYSRIVGSQEEFLKKFVSSGKVPWDFYWRGETQASRVDFASIMIHALRRNTHLLLIMKLPDSVAVILRFTRPVLAATKRAGLFSGNGQNGCENQNLQGFLDIEAVFISQHFGYIERYALDDPTYKIDLSDKGMQLYRERTAVTFVHIKVGSPLPNRTEDGIPNLMISVDLNRFDRRILQNSRRHPLVRKAPTFDLEIFVSNRRCDHSSQPSRVANLDVLIESGMKWSSAIFIPTNISLPDEDSDEDIQNLLLEASTQIVQEIRSSFMDMDELQSEPAKSVALYHSRVLEPAHQLFAVTNFMPLDLRDLVIETAHGVFTKLIPLLAASEQIDTMTSCVAKLSDLSIDMVPALSSMGLNSGDDHTNDCVSRFIQIVRKWDFWFALSSSEKKNGFLNFLEKQIRPRLIRGGRAQFAFRNAREQIDVLLEELQNGSEDSRTSASVSRILNLRMEPTEPDRYKNVPDEQITTPPDHHRPVHSKSKKKLPVVSMFCVHAASIPVGVRFATGEYVCISRQATAGQTTDSKPNSSSSQEWSEAYDEEFPPLGGAIKKSMQVSDQLISKPPSFCLGTVVSVCDAPFSVKVKLVAPSYAQSQQTPEFIEHCLLKKKDIFWELSMVPANVVAHMRNMDAISAFLGAQADARNKLVVTPDILPYFIPSLIHPSRINPAFEATAEHVSQKLNKQQKEAVLSALTNTVSLVHGPPGTGALIVSIKSV